MREIAQVEMVGLCEFGEAGPLGRKGRFLARRADPGERFRRARIQGPSGRGDGHRPDLRAGAASARRCRRAAGRRRQDTAWRRAAAALSGVEDGATCVTILGPGVRRAMTYEHLIVEHRGRVSWIYLNRPNVLNALSMHTMGELRAVLTELRDARKRASSCSPARAGRSAPGADMTGAPDPKAPPSEEPTFLTTPTRWRKC